MVSSKENYHFNTWHARQSYNCFGPCVYSCILLKCTIVCTLKVINEIVFITFYISATAISLVLKLHLG